MLGPILKNGTEFRAFVFVNEIDPYIELQESGEIAQICLPHKIGDVTEFLLQDLHIVYRVVLYGLGTDCGVEGLDTYLGLSDLLGYSGVGVTHLLQMVGPDSDLLVEMAWGLADGVHPQRAPGCTIFGILPMIATSDEADEVSDGWQVLECGGLGVFGCQYLADTFHVRWFDLERIDIERSQKRFRGS